MFCDEHESESDSLGCHIGIVPVNREGLKATEAKRLLSIQQAVTCHSRRTKGTRVCHDSVIEVSLKP